MRLPSYTKFQALQRFAIFSESCYPQTITWNRLIWEPKPTTKIKLIPWYLLSISMATMNLSFYFTLFSQILSYTKDPDISFELGLFLVMYCAAFTLGSAVCFTYASRAEEILFLFRNLLKNAGMQDYLHSMHGVILYGTVQKACDRFVGRKCEDIL